MGIDGRAARDDRESFDVGDLVVHPHHGAGRIINRCQRHLAGRNGIYLEIEIKDGGLKILVPCDSTGTIGLRKVADRSRLGPIVAVLEAAPDTVHGNWTTRERIYRDRLKTGDALAWAAVARDLGARATDSDLSAREKRLHQRARQLLTSELAYSLGIDTAQATTFIDWHLAPRPTARDPRERLCEKL